MEVVSAVLSGLSLVAVVVIGAFSVRLGRDASRSAATSAAASIRAVELAEQDAVVRRLERALDIVLEMRRTFNEQMEAGLNGPVLDEATSLARLNLNRHLESALPAVEALSPELESVFAFPQPVSWNSKSMEDSIRQLKQAIQRVVNAAERA